MGDNAAPPAQCLPLIVSMRPGGVKDLEGFAMKEIRKVADDLVIAEYYPRT